MKHSRRVGFSCRIFHRIDEPFNRIISRAQFCEKHGFSSIIIDDHILYGAKEATAPDPFSTVALLAASTRKIRIGILVTDLIRRNPAIVAQSLATLDSMFPSRIFLGLGAGDPINQAPIGIPTDHRFSKLAEGLEIMKILWDSNIQNPKSFHGKYYNLKRAYLQLGQEKRPFPDMYLAAFGPRMLKLTGKDANGWIPHCHTSETYKNDLAIIMRSRQKGSNRSRFHSAYYTLTSISKNREQANQRVLGPAKYFLALIPEALKKIDPTAQHPGRVWENIADPRVQRETIRKIATPIPDKDAYDTVIHGSADDCIGQIENYRRAGCEEFMLTFVNNGGLWSTENLLLQIQYFKKSVIDYYNNN